MTVDYHTAGVWNVIDPTPDPAINFEGPKSGYQSFLFVVAKIISSDPRFACNDNYVGAMHCTLSGVHAVST
jgi:hypothetical protein